MAKHHGTEGLVYAGSGPTAVGEVVGWTYEEESEIFSDWAIGDSAKDYAVGTKGGSGTVEFFEDETNTGQDEFIVGSTVTLYLYTEGRDSGDVEFTGSVRISGKSISLDKSSFNMTRISYVGALTEGTYTP